MRLRWVFIVLLLIAVITAILVRLYHVHVHQQDFLVKQGSSRSNRYLTIAADR